ncbi:MULTISPECIES: hypothetical protein [Clostridium]|uniref:hypothetical protein n=1 Tax=Clostridium TaxID=1485 RepID=UPI00214A71DC|nr:MULTISPECIES: hypothetical protein [Clostridium]MCR1951711.1 hypothetical protein [Clostridium sp. DSM 100503]MDI9218850.1 hypothetical protein [Clostridium tertium]
MLKLQPIEFFLRVLPEGFLFIFAIYVFSKVRINKKKYIVSSLILSTLIYIIRMLPISYGVHTILSMLFLVFFTMLYNKIDVARVIRSIIFIYVIQFLSEGINMVIIKLIPNFEMLFKDPIYKTILGLPSLIIAGLIVLTFYKIFKKRDEFIDV